MVGYTPVDVDDNKRATVTNDQINASVVLLTCAAALGGMLFGYDTGIISGAILLIKSPSNFDIDEHSQATLLEIIVSGATAGAIFGAGLSPVLNKLGRRPVIMCSDLIFVGGSLLMAFTQNISLLILGRFVVGVGIGLASSTVPMYV